MGFRGLGFRGLGVWGFGGLGVLGFRGFWGLGFRVAKSFLDVKRFQGPGITVFMCCCGASL